MGNNTCTDSTFLPQDPTFLANFHVGKRFNESHKKISTVGNHDKIGYLFSQIYLQFPEHCTCLNILEAAELLWMMYVGHECIILYLAHFEPCEANGAASKAVL